jgi:hypothetical protein
MAFWAIVFPSLNAFNTHEYAFNAHGQRTMGEGLNSPLHAHKENVLSFLIKNALFNNIVLIDVCIIKEDRMLEFSRACRHERRMAAAKDF